MRTWVFVVLACVFITGITGVGGGCGEPKRIKMGPLPDKLTRGSLAGPLCGGAECKCASSPREAGTPEQDQRKRFEIKLLSPYELWVTLPGNTLLYKNAERAEACFYVDFAPGQHPVELRASNASGVVVEMQIHELGAKGSYDTFKFNCGNPGVCSYEQVDAEMARMKAFPKGLHDACGSTKIKGVAWDHGKGPDQLHPSDLVLQLTLDIFKFKPELPSGSGEACSKRAPKGGAEPAPAPTTEPAPEAP